MNVAVLGYGTIGSGTVEVLDKNAEVLKQRAGEAINVKYILDLRDFPGDKHEAQLTKDFNQIVNDPDVNIVVECMGGLHPAYDFVKAALLAGKAVTTSNKAIVAAFGPELARIAGENGTNFMFEASVGGGIPIIRPLRTSFTADVVEEITGILNGTTNFMLTKMDREGRAYEDVLKEAQALGYAEKDPTADVEGHDTGRKIAILTSLVCGKQVAFEDIPLEGITKIEVADFKYAAQMNRGIKLVGSSRRVGDTFSILVAPFMIPAEHPLGNVSDVYNGIMVCGNAVGTTMFYGRGAGKLPTASAIVGDIVELAKHLHRVIPITWSEEKLELADPKEVSYRFFVRMKGTEAEAKKLFEGCEIIHAEGVEGEFGLVTPEMKEKDYDAIAAKTTDIIKMIRLG